MAIVPNLVECPKTCNTKWFQLIDARVQTNDLIETNVAGLETYTEFSASDTGVALNGALFAAFDDMLDSISFALGREAARVMAGQGL